MKAFRTDSAEATRHGSRTALLRLLLASFVLFLVGMAPASGAQSMLDLSIAVDDGYAAWLGTSASLTTPIGANEGCGVPSGHVHSGIPLAGATHLYVVAYDNEFNTQGLLLEASLDGSKVYSGHPAWEVFATTLDRDPVCAGGQGPPSVSEVEAQIQLANAAAGPAGGSVTWVDTQGGGTGVLAIGPANDGAPADPGFVAIPEVSTLAYWMWYDHEIGPDTPFRALDDAEYLIFRLPLAALRSCTPPPSGRFSWWSLDESRGQVAHDVLAGFDGSWVDGPVPVPGVVGGALSFPGAGDFVSVADSVTTSFPAGADLTIDLWLRTSTDVSGVRTLLDKRDNPASPLGFSLYLLNGNLGFQMADGGGSNICSSNPASSCTNFGSSAFVADGEWHFVAVSIDRDGQGFFYVDGDVVASINPSSRTGSMDASAPLLIGRQAAGFLTAPFDGTLDEIEIFRGALSEAELDSIWDAASSGKCKQTLHVPWDAQRCPGEAFTRTTVRACNQSAAPQGYELSFAPTPELPGPRSSCTTEGPTGFEVVGGRSFTLPPLGCKDLEVHIDHPSGFVGSGAIACFQATLEDLNNGSVTTDSGSIYGHDKVCPEPEKSIYSPNLANPTTSAFSLASINGFSGTLDYEIRVFDPDMEPDDEIFSLGGLPPGEPVRGSVLVQPGQPAEVAVETAVARERFNAFYDLVLGADADGDGEFDAVTSTGLQIRPPICVAGDYALCLNGSRFRIQVTWEDFQGNTGVGTAVPLTTDTGYFWFFRDTNVELIIKVLDGRPVNDHWWVFYGALSNVEYTITVTDTQTGREKSYANSAGRFASAGDTTAFPGEAGTGGPLAVPAFPIHAAPFGQNLASLDEASIGIVGETQGACGGGPQALCLNDNRFRVEVVWEDFQGNTGVGAAEPLTTDTGYFWFFRDTNVEVVIKVLDGRPVNGHWWVFYGALSNVEYTIAVTDTATGDVRTYTNPARTFASRGDTTAFVG